MGGTSALGALGYVNAAFEVIEQATTFDLGPLSIQRGDFVLPDVVYVAAGTLGTAIGLAVGFAAAGVHTKVVAVRVTPIEVGSDATAEKLAAETIALLRALDSGFPDISPGDLNFELRHDWFEPGYGVVTPETTEAVAQAAAYHVKLETTYTGKAFAALLGDARGGRIDRADHVLFWEPTVRARCHPRGPTSCSPRCSGNTLRSVTGCSGAAREAPHEWQFAVCCRGRAERRYALMRMGANGDKRSDCGETCSLCRRPRVQRGGRD